jgi:hypothetical protein
MDDLGMNNHLPFLRNTEYLKGLSNYRKEYEAKVLGVTVARQEAQGKSYVFALSVGYAIPLGGK